MSNCCFVVVENGKYFYFVEHYSIIKYILKGFNHKRLIEAKWNRDFAYSDTDCIPAVIIDFDNKVLTETIYNRFDDFKQYMPDGWKYVKNNGDGK